MATTMDCGVAPATRGWRLRSRWAAWRMDRLARRQLKNVDHLPDYLRKDIGLDVGLPPDGFTNGGRTFITSGVLDSTLSSWHW